MNDYKDFSYYFDEIMDQIEYSDWLNFTKEYIHKKDKILDLACGSGTLAIFLKMLDYDVEGLDLSSKMIEVAKEKAKMNHLNIPFHVQDMTTFKFDYKFNVITCYFDSINHLPTFKMVQDTFDRVYEALDNNGIFIFDVFSKYAYKHSKGSTSTDLYSCSYNWDITLSKPNILTHNITIFDEDKTINEIYNEYYYPIEDLLNDPRFSLLAVSGDFTDRYDNKSGRILIVLEKR